MHERFGIRGMLVRIHGNESEIWRGWELDVESEWRRKKYSIPT
jgi:hypothetical protein